MKTLRRRVWLQTILRIFVKSQQWQSNGADLLSVIPLRGQQFVKVSEEFLQHAAQICAGAKDPNLDLR